MSVDATRRHALGVVGRGPERVGTGRVVDQRDARPGDLLALAPDEQRAALHDRLARERTADEARAGSG